MRVPNASSRLVLNIVKKGWAYMSETELGLVQIYTGPGKGKTTAALGLAFRAAGHGFRVHIIQYMKGSFYAGELQSIARAFPIITIAQYGKGCPYSGLIRQGKQKCKGCGQCFIRGGQPTQEDHDLAQMAYADSLECAQSGEIQMLILDEIGNALRYNLVSIGQVLELIQSKHPKTELVLTGRGMPEEIQAAADLVTQLTDIKHPYREKGIGSRRGVEY